MATVSKICLEMLEKVSVTGIKETAIYHNLQTSIVDIYGISYYSPSVMENIIKRVVAEMA